MPSGIDFIEVPAGQVAPPAGVRRVYAKDDGLLYIRYSDGTERIIGPSEVLVPFLAAVNLTQYQPVTVDGLLANSATLAHKNKVIGLVWATVASGFSGNALLEGEMTNPLWTWTAGSPLYLNGTTLSQTPPTTGFLQRIAVARTDMTIIIQPKHPILL